ncbi:MAG: hypothetical protein FJ311_08750 [Rhodospirillales bacterium]|nr:hypothetical protein [Rhodospirillales bacterium]
MTRKTVALVAVLVAAVALTACRGEEQGRVTMYKKGQYLGQKDDTLSEAQVSVLRERAAEQAGTSLGLTATVPTRGLDVRVGDEPAKK